VNEHLPINVIFPPGEIFILLPKEDQKLFLKYLLSSGNMFDDLMKIAIPWYENPRIMQYVSETKMMEIIKSQNTSQIDDENTQENDMKNLKLWHEIINKRAM